MLSRKFWSIVLVLLAVGVMIIARGIVGGLIGAFLLIVMLFLWVVPEGAFSHNPQRPGPTVKNLLQSFLGIGFGLLAAITTALVLPPQLFSWVIMAAGIALIVWIFLRYR